MFARSLLIVNGATAGTKSEHSAVTHGMLRGNAVIGNKGELVLVLEKLCTGRNEYGKSMHGSACDCHMTIPIIKIFGGYPNKSLPA